jgi:hypothetical protein
LQFGLGFSKLFIKGRLKLFFGYGLLFQLNSKVHRFFLRDWLA